MAIKDGLNIKDGEIRSYLLIGQSNMAGRGTVGDVPPIENKSCLMLRMGRWQKMSEPINPDRSIFEGSPRSGICLGASFADEVARATGDRVGLIPCADGGTKLSQWMPGEVLYDHAVMMTKLAMRSSRLCGILWHLFCVTSQLLLLKGQGSALYVPVSSYPSHLILSPCALKQCSSHQSSPVEQNSQ